jgi:hypothetical protein
MRIEITDGGVSVQHEGQHDDVVVKTVDVQDLSRALAGDITFDTGWLAPRIHRYSQIGGLTNVLLETPPKLRRITYLSQVFENVPTPRCLWKFRLRGMVLDYSAVVACMDVVPPGMEWMAQDTSQVARLPFPNVYQDTHICWGRTSIPPLSLVTIGGLAELFWGAPFNRDLEHMGLPQTWRGAPPPQGPTMLRAFQREGVNFPMDFLARLGTLRQWWDGYVG